MNSSRVTNRSESFITYIVDHEACVVQLHSIIEILIRFVTTENRRQIETNKNIFKSRSSSIFEAEFWCKSSSSRFWIRKEGGIYRSNSSWNSYCVSIPNNHCFSFRKFFTFSDLYVIWMWFDEDDYFYYTTELICRLEQYMPHRHCISDCLFM